jgi:hypothetical protein
LDLEARLEDASREIPDERAELEAGFIEHGYEWAERRKVSYAALRSVGVPARVLREAGWS